MSANTLFVPIEIQAMVVNDQSRKAENFQRWKMNYTNLSSYASPMPSAFSGNTAVDWNNIPSANGVYLHWTLPHALRTGVQKNITGKTEYPLVPNRWLVVRYSGPLTARIATAWVVENDYLDPDNGTSPYIDPTSVDTLAVTLIGRKVDLTSWSESGSKDLFLTAIGAGDITFSAYQPYNENVFSIHDPLTDVTDPTISYMVAGWFSDETKDILASVIDQQIFTEILSNLNWQVDASIEQPCSVSVYQGICYGIDWNQTGPVPTSNKPNSATVAVGNTSIDALTALINQQANGDQSINAQLLEAFQYNLLPVLDQPNGPELLYRAIHKTWFGKQNGGYEFVIVKTPSDQTGSSPDVPYPDSPLDWSDPKLDPDWLATLNQNQASYDDAYRTLQSIQWDLYRMWWTKGNFANIGPSNQNALTGKNPDFTDHYFNQQLDPSTANSTAQRAQKKGELVAQLLSIIPNGDTQATLQQSVQAYAVANNLPDGYELKRYNKDTFYKANDPVVLVSGSKGSIPLVDGTPLPCRFESQLISGLKYLTSKITVSSMNNKIPSIDFINIPAIPTALLDEFFFTDPNNATMIATIALADSSIETISALTTQISNHIDETGTLPAFTLANWQQPWSPMFLMWTIMYYPIAHDINGDDSWNFNGEKYNLSNKNIPLTNPQDLVLSGTTLLTPQSSFSFKNRLTEYRSKHPNLDPTELKALEDFITSTDDWDFLSQTLDGFMQQLTSRDSESNVIPSGSDNLSPLIGSNNSIVPILGSTPQPFEGWPISNFQIYRSGQFCFQKLMLVDRFGQALQLSSSKTYTQLKPIIAPDMTPVNTVLSEEPHRFVQLSPRLLQPARLNFDFTSATDDSKIINLHSGINPVCAWILPNHMDKSLACYNPSGGYFGELRVITNDQATKVVNWEFAPNSIYTTLAEITTAFPHLGEMLSALIAKGPDAFSNFYQVIDETLWVVDPLGSRDDQNLSVLVGRPLALARCRLKYQLDGSPITDPSWQYTFNKASAAFINYTFSVRLGELKLRNDGLIGYFTGSNYEQFNCVHMPSDGTLIPVSPPYNVQVTEGNFIDLTFDNSSESYLTMLFDPRASVHATTAILPSKILNLPAKFIEPALNAMDINFKIGPLLSVLTTEKSGSKGGEVITMLMPKPSENCGTWSWLEPDGSDWKSYPIKSTDEKANFSNIKPKLRSGILKLLGSKKQDKTN